MGSVAGGLLAVPLAVRAQRKAMPVIGVLTATSPIPFAPLMRAFHQGLSEAGYVEGQNVAIEYRFAEGHYDRLPALAAKAETVPPVAAMTATCRRTNSAASAASRSYWPSAQRYSIATFSPKPW